MAKNKNKQNGVNNADENLKRALEILASGERGKDYDEALRYVKVNNPNHSILQEIEKEAKSQDEAPKPQNEEDSRTAEAVENAMRFIKEDRNERECLGDENQGLKEDKAVEKNLNEISSIFDEEQVKYRLQAYSDTYGRFDFKSDKELLSESSKKLTEEDLRKKYINEVLESAKHEVLMFYARDEKFASYDREQKRAILKDGVSEVFSFKMMKAVGASAIKEATAEEAVPQSKANEDYIRRSETDMRDALKAFFEKRPVEVSAQQVLNTTVKTSDAMDDYEKGLSAAKLKKASKSFNQKKEDYNEKRRGFWGKAFDMVKGVYQGIKQNKARIITDAAFVAFTGALAMIATPAAVAAAAGSMGAYFAVGSYAWQVDAERRNQKAKAEDKAKWSGFKGLGNAWKSIKEDKQKYKKFKVQGAVGAAAGIVGAGLFGVAASYLSVAAGRIASGVVRTAGSVATQGAFYGMASRDFAKNKTEENKAARDTARTSFWTSLGVAGLASAVSAYFGLDHINGAENAGTGVDGNTGVDAGNGGAYGAGNGGAEGAGNGGADGTGVEGTTVEHTPVNVPTEWNESMGISKAHWDLMQSRFAKSNVSFEEAYTNAYNAKMSNPELFKDIDPVKVVDEYYLKDSWVKEINSYGIYETKEGLLKAIHGNQNATVVEVSDFNNVNPVKGAIYHHQITSFGVDGKPVVHDFYSTDIARLHQHDTMFRLEKIIECGEKIEISTADANAMILAERISGDRNIVVDTFGPCGEKDTYVSFANKHNIGKIPDAHEQVLEPGNADEITIDNQNPVEGANVDETVIDVQKEAPDEHNFKWREQKYTTKDNTLISGSGDTPVKIVAQGKGILNSGR